MKVERIFPFNFIYPSWFQVEIYKNHKKEIHSSTNLIDDDSDETNCPKNLRQLIEREKLNGKGEYGSKVQRSNFNSYNWNWFDCHSWRETIGDKLFDTFLA